MAENVYLPRPVSIVMQRIDDIASAYSSLRATRRPEDALAGAVATALQGEDRELVVAFLAGKMDRTYGRKSGKKLSESLIGHCEELHQMDEAFRGLMDRPPWENDK